MADSLCHRSFFSCKGNTLNVRNQSINQSKKYVVNASRMYNQQKEATGGETVDVGISKSEYEAATICL